MTTTSGARLGSASQAIYDRHQQLFFGLLEHLKRIEEQAETDASAFVTFLTEDLLPQVFGEEERLYPSLHSAGTTTDTMSVDHEFIEAYVRRIEQAALTLKRAREANQPAARRELVRLGRQLEAILELHLAKEDHIYLPLLKHIGEGQRQAILKGEDHLPEPAEQKALVVKDLVDARGLSPVACHARAFAAFGALQSGEAFILVSDHDSQPLYYQLTFEYRGRLVWESLEKGPGTWRVSIGKGA